jgi:2-polyprenyl-3-methyl-5-hydroxy-6-metoxy-1,4-benzoquinol methylase
LKSEWFETFFQGPAVEFWTRARPREITIAEADFLEKALALRPGARVLDVPCGNGRHSIELARRGYRVTGIDLSQEFLQAAKVAEAESGVEAEWRFGDMRQLALEPSGFDAAFCFGNSFGYLDHSAARAFFAALARGLKPGDRLVIDTSMAAESILPTLVPQRWHRMGGLLVLSQARYDASASRLDIDYTFVREGIEETRPTCSYVFTAAEIQRMLDAAGFDVAAFNGGIVGEPFAAGLPRLLITAARRE